VHLIEALVIIYYFVLVLTPRLERVEQTIDQPSEIRARLALVLRFQVSPLLVFVSCNHNVSQAIQTDDKVKKIGAFLINHL
jgi:hypothetical protein